MIQGIGKQRQRRHLEIKVFNISGPRIFGLTRKLPVFGSYKTIMASFYNKTLVIEPTLFKNDFLTRLRMSGVNRKYSIFAPFGLFISPKGIF